jgi:hypothetical protein
MLPPRRKITKVRRVDGTGVTQAVYGESEEAKEIQPQAAEPEKSRARGRPKKYQSVKPWEAEGISKSAWYRKERSPES